MKDQLVKLIMENKKMTLKDIYSYFKNEKQEKIRSNLNYLVNNNQIKRIARGKYEVIDIEKQ